MSSNDKIDVSQLEQTVSQPDDLNKDHIDYDRIDKELAQYASASKTEITPEDDKRLKRMIDKRVLSIMIVTYFFQAIDKGTMSFSAIMGIQEDLGLEHGQRVSLREHSLIYILTSTIPMAHHLHLHCRAGCRISYQLAHSRVSIAKYLGINIVLRGSTLALHAACKNFPSILAVRTLLGIFEAVCQPSFLVLSSMWYKRSEQAATVTYWYTMNGAQQIVGGLLAYCFSLITSGPLKSYQAQFITYGVISIARRIFVFFWMPDSPMRAKCFSEEDKKLIIERVRSNQTGIQNKRFRPEQVKEALMDPQTWCYCLIAICTTLPTSGLGAFAGIIIKGFEFTLLQTQLLAMVLGAYIIIVLLSSTYLTNRFDQNIFIMLIYVIPSFIGTIVLMTVKNTTLATKVGFADQLLHRA